MVHATTMSNPSSNAVAERRISIDDGTDSPMTPAEQSEFLKWHAKLLGGTEQIAEALSTILEKRLHRASFSSFDDYVRLNCSFCRAYAFRLVQAHRCRTRSTFGDSPRPANILQAIELSGIDAAAHESVMREAQLRAKAGKITAMLIRRIVRERKGKAIVEPQFRRVEFANNSAEATSVRALVRRLREKIIADASREDLLALVDGIERAFDGDCTQAGQTIKGQLLEATANHTPDEPTLAAHNVKQPEAPMPSSESNQNL